jgi:4-amino-4-deoxy-L-arabinose transferase-like glycosyltransferase
VAFCFGYQAIRNHAPSGRATRRPETAWSAIGWLGLFYAAMAAAVLLKGPIGLALPLLAVMTFLVVQGEPVFPWHGRRWLKLMHELGVWWGVLLFLALVLPWFVLAQQATDGTFFREFFIRHNLQRGLGGDELLEAHDSSLAFGYYVIRLAYDAAPWSWLLPVAGFLLWKRHWLRDEPVARFACAWFVSMLVFFSLMRYKRPDYLLPALPGLALLLGVAAERCWRAAGRRMRLALACGGSVAVLAVVAGWLVYAQFVLPRAEPAREQRSFAAAVRRHAGPDSPIVLFRTEPHALMFHVGRPITRIMEWENLDVWAAQPAAFYVVMPAKWADERLIEQHLEAGRLYCVTSNSLLAGMEHEEPLVLFCTRPIE